MSESQPQGRPRPRFRMLEVSRVQALTSHMVRVTLAGSELEGFQEPAPSQHVKIIFPKPGESRPALPDFSGGPPQPGAERPLMRTYTPRRFDPRRLELDIEFFVHGDGPASSWARSARPGDSVAVAGPGGRFQPNPEAGWYVLAADESALPAMSMILDWLPSSVPVQAFVEVGDGADELALEGHPNVRLSWLRRSGADRPGSRLERALGDVRLPAGPGQVWVACEASAVRAIRRHMLDLHLDPAMLITRGYWKSGESNHPDHDYGED